MREFKFRLIKNNKIVGYEKFEGGEWVYSIDGKNWYSGNWLVYDNKTQFTGLRDKNGKEIYEGDIISISFLAGKNYSLVEWSRYEGGFVARELSWRGIYHLRCLGEKEEEYEALGNIHENPELLEDK